LSVISRPRPANQEPQHARPRGRRTWGFVVFLVVVLVAGGLAMGSIRYIDHCKGASGPKVPVTVVVPRGTSGGEVAEILHRRGVIRCGGLISHFLVGTDDRAGSIRAGTYQLTTNMGLPAALTVLTAPPHRAKTIRLTVPEGYRLTQIADRVHEEFGIPAAEFMALATSGAYALPPYLPEGTRSVEGFLFPATYDVVAKGASADGIISLLLGQFGKEVADLPWRNAAALGVTPYQVVTVASMIEREAGVDSDRPLIAAVIYNRLERHMPLGIDATLQYVDPNPDNGLTTSDFHINSPYNTRTHVGLPPTPIASPRLDSIVAALQPAKVRYLYYVLCDADGQGHHRFSVSYGQFLRDRHACLGK